MSSKKKYTGGKPRHNLITHIIPTNEYVNPEKPSDKWCLCYYCNKVNEELQNYERSRIDFDNAFEFDSDDNNNYDSVSIYSEQTTRSTESTTSQSTNILQISNPNKIIHYIARTLTCKEQTQFEKSILNMTIENG
ncbi:6258_t:CDS:2 [Dentiscutata heterogama]|uniref:6258_t:CDS:1 n=1 Tax=Dentiscutata heterogama TaxID=1316150 RepID=A0ACA9MPZ1_9GLOM|nr:6258_t:CDS:2 [Dentiscutata heterogama]